MGCDGCWSAAGPALVASVWALAPSIALTFPQGKPQRMVRVMAEPALSLECRTRPCSPQGWYGAGASGHGLEDSEHVLCWGETQTVGLPGLPLCLGTEQVTGMDASMWGHPEGSGAMNPSLFPGLPSRESGACGGTTLTCQPYCCHLLSAVLLCRKGAVVGACPSWDPPAPSTLLQGLSLLGFTFPLRALEPCPRLPWQVSQRV